MKIISAIDSMKGSLSSVEANKIIEEVFMSEEVQVKKIAIADGGEGTVEAFITNYTGQYEQISCQNLRGKVGTSFFGWLAQEKIAVIESALTCGIQFLDGTDRTHPSQTNSAGLGESILAALDKGAKTIIIGLGGTGTVDGGMGAMHALGVEFFDISGNVLSPKGENLGLVRQVSKENLDARVNNVEFIIAADVESPLTGPTGAVYMFGTQKGIKQEELKTYETMMINYEQVLLDGDTPQKGDGAAGGLGIALRKLLNAKMVRGFDLIAHYSALEEEIRTADLVITGEGKIDSQSLQGKVPIGIGQIAKKYQLPVIAFVGSVEGDPAIFHLNGLDVVIPIVDRISSLGEAMKNAKGNLKRAAMRTKQLLFLLK
ncbi:glycerate kinase [Vagococcus elongatus]|uniref:Glycerate kinase n=1 Tax=Vagococcus elongatus TaxID=180344 RepID=A0A430AX59_9ENTE|nr:glycerate kinase [Vagococcus elongatus]RSU12661.1 glycerate kinase [Vagococcus elongatus]